MRFFRPYSLRYKHGFRSAWPVWAYAGFCGYPDGHPLCCPDGRAGGRFWVEEYPAELLPPLAGVVLRLTLWDNWDSRVVGQSTVPYWKTGPVSFEERRMGVLKDFLEKAAQIGAAAGGDNAGFADEKFAKLYPAMTEFMTTTEVEGKKRETATLFLFVDKARWKGCFTDRDTQKTVWKENDTFLGLLGALEKEVAKGPEGDWRSKVTERKGRK